MAQDEHTPKTVIGNITTDQLRALIANWFRDHRDKATGAYNDLLGVKDVVNTDNGLHVALSNGQYFSIKTEHLYLTEFAIFKAQSLGHCFTHGWAKNTGFWHITCDRCARQVLIRNHEMSGFALDERCDDGADAIK